MLIISTSYLAGYPTQAHVSSSQKTQIHAHVSKRMIDIRKEKLEKREGDKTKERQKGRKGKERRRQKKEGAG